MEMEMVWKADTLGIGVGSTLPNGKLGGDRLQSEQILWIGEIFISRADTVAFLDPVMMILGEAFLRVKHPLRLTFTFQSPW
jgi:hypothetical protein